jgi:tetratricopeptide (TPR) repeat protein
MKTYGTNGIPLEAQYLYRRGVEMLSQQKDETAMKYFRQAVFIAPSFSRAYHELANCLRKQKRADEAAIYEMKAQRNDPLTRGPSHNGFNMERPNAEMEDSRLISQQLIS